MNPGYWAIYEQMSPEIVSAIPSIYLGFVCMPYLWLISDHIKLLLWSLFTPHVWTSVHNLPQAQLDSFWKHQPYYIEKVYYMQFHFKIYFILGSLYCSIQNNMLYSNNYIKIKQQSVLPENWKNVPRYLNSLHPLFICLH